MTKKDVLELTRRFKKTECTFTRMCGCYVDAEKNIVTRLGETFLNLEEDEFHKYLEIAKKTLSGTIGNNLLELDFPMDEENVGGKQQFLMGLRESKLKNDELLETFYKLIIDNYDYTGNYLILVYHDAYDVMVKTSDNNKLDESEEVYEYLLCSICPVTLSKPGLGYLPDDNRIGVRVRDWVVGVPENGFLFPAFTDRSTDIHSVMFFTRNAKEPHPEFMEAGLGCPSKHTATENKITFNSIIKNALGGEDENNSHVIMDIQDNLNNMIPDEEEVETMVEPVVLTNDSIQEILTESGVPEEVTAKIEKSYTEEFGETPPVVEHLLDSKILAANEIRKKEKALVQQITTLQQKLDESQQNVQFNAQASALEASLATENSVDDGFADVLVDEETGEILSPEDSETSEGNANYDVVLRVKPQKVPLITSQVINGKKCIVIPLDDNEQANVNGETVV